MTVRADRNALVPTILKARRATPARRATLVALTGIDGAGKGYVARQLVHELRSYGMNVADLTVDGWLNLPHVRFDDQNPAEHFYLHALRFEEMFERLLLPLRERRSVRLDADYAAETATTYRPHVYAYDDIDVIVLEGIYLLKRELRRHYDVSVWIDCTFETALERAIARAQEGLPPDQTVAAYQRIYFPAQRLHFERDAPQMAATATLINDPRLGETWERA